MKVTLKTKPQDAADVYIAANDATTAHKNIADYQCDGTADEVQIDAAIDELGTAGGVIRLSEGLLFSLTDEIEIPAKVSVMGSGRGSTKITQTTSSKSIFNAGDNDDIRITDLWLVEPTTNAGDTIIAGGTGAIIERLTLQGGTTSTWHIHLSNAFSYAIRDIKNFGTLGNGICIDNTDNLYHYGNAQVSNVEISLRSGAKGIGLYRYDEGKSVNLIDFSSINIVAPSQIGNGNIGIDIDGVNTCTWSMIDLESHDTKLNMVNAKWHTFTTLLSLSGDPQIDISLDEDSSQNVFIGTVLANSYKNVVDEGTDNLFVGGRYE